MGQLNHTDASGDKAKETTAPTQAASKYPEKALSIIAPSGAGGGWDMTARTIAKVLSETKALDKPISVENKPGGGGSRLHGGICHERCERQLQIVR